MSKLTKSSNLILRVVIIAAFVLSAVLIMQSTGVFSAVGDSLQSVADAIDTSSGDIALKQSITQADADKIVNSLADFSEQNVSKINLFSTLSLVLLILSAAAAVLSWIAFKASGLGASITRGIFLIIGFFNCLGAYNCFSIAKWCANNPNADPSGTVAIDISDRVKDLLSNSNLTFDTAKSMPVVSTLITMGAALFVFMAAAILLVLTITSIVSIVKSSKAAD